MGPDADLYRQQAQTSDATNDLDATLKEINETISTIVGLDAVKDQLKKWMKGLLISQRRKSLGIKVGAPNVFHMAFLGNPGTGKTMVARILGKLLHKLGLVSTDKVVEVQRTDLVGEFIGHTGPRTRKKIEEASGGILFVDEAYRLIPRDTVRDFGREALEEIMSAMDKGDIITIFAGYTNEMNRVFTANAGFTRRVSKVFHFEDYTPEDISMIMLSKFKAPEKESRMQGLKLHRECTVKAIASMISKHIPNEVLKRMNGGLVNPWLANALENLDLRLDVKCTNADVLTTITKEDLDEGLQSLQKSMATESNSMENLAIQMSFPATSTSSPAAKKADVEKKSPTKKEAPVEKAVKRKYPAKMTPVAKKATPEKKEAPTKKAVKRKSTAKMAPVAKKATPEKKEALTKKAVKRKSTAKMAPVAKKEAPTKKAVGIRSSERISARK